jgi:hypothetical protein
LVSLYDDFELAAGANTSLKQESFVSLLMQYLPHLKTNVPAELLTITSPPASPSTSATSSSVVADSATKLLRVSLPSALPVEQVLFDSIYRSLPREKDGTLGFPSFASVMHTFRKCALEDRFVFIHSVFFGTKDANSCDVDEFHKLLRALYRVSFDGSTSFFVNEPKLRKFAEYVFNKSAGEALEEMNLEQIRTLVLEPGLLQECWAQLLQA